MSASILPVSEMMDGTEMADPWNYFPPPSALETDRNDDEHSDGSSKTKAPVPPFKSMAEVHRTLELMHDRCIARNLKAAGLGGFESSEDENIYGNLDANAQMETGESILRTVLAQVSDPEKQFRYVSLLVSEGADVNEQDRRGRTPLMLALEEGTDRTAKVILHQESINLILKDQDGNSGLHYAAAYGRLKPMKPFFKCLRRMEKERRSQGLPSEDLLDMKNDNGETPQELAAKHGNTDCASFLGEEKHRRVKLLSKQLSLLQHTRMIGTPLLRATRNSGGKILKRYSSFDSLFADNLAVDDSSDEDEPMESSGGGNDFSLNRLKQELKFQSQPEFLNRRAMKSTSIPLEESESTGTSSPQQSEKSASVKTAPFQSRAAMIRSKSEMIREMALGHHGQRLRRLLSTGDSEKSESRRGFLETAETIDTSTEEQVPKRRFTDRIRNLLRRRPRYEMQSSESMNALSEFRRQSMENLDKKTPEAKTLKRGISQPNVLGRGKDRKASVNAEEQSVEVDIKPHIAKISPQQKPNVLNMRPEIPDLRKRMEKNRKSHSKRESSLPPIRNAHLLEKPKQIYQL